MDITQKPQVFGTLHLVGSHSRVGVRVNAGYGDAMKYVVLPVHDSESEEVVYAIAELRSYEPPIYWGPFYSVTSAHEHAKADQHRVPYEVEQ